MTDKPECPYCGATEGLRQVCDGGGYIAPEYSCEGCFTPRDDGPCFDDLPETPPMRIRVAQDKDGFWTCREAVSGSQEYVRADVCDFESPAEDYCPNCGGEGYVYSCFEEYACVDPEGGCDMCERRCDWCNPSSRRSSAHSRSRAL